MTPSLGIISADDHLVEPADIWLKRLPRRYQEIGPRLVRQRGGLIQGDSHSLATEMEFREHPEGEWADIWHYENTRIPLVNGAAAAGFSREELSYRAMSYDEIRPGCFDQRARLGDMDQAGIEASLCFPNTFVRFCGQRFFHAADKQLAALCVMAYNDFIVEEWCEGSGGRLIPCAIVPLWDADLAAEEVLRMSGKGVHAVSFSELPPFLGLPSIHSGYWDPFISACESTETAIMMHVGSSSRLPKTSDDAPYAVALALPSTNSAASLVDWICSGKLAQFPRLKLCLAESNMGWIPYFLERLDLLWSENSIYTPSYLGNETLRERPSHYYYGGFFVTFFNDAFGTQNLHAVGENNAIFETDYPHGDTSWPHCRELAETQTAHLAPEVKRKVLRENACRLLSIAL